MHKPILMLVCFLLIVTLIACNGTQENNNKSPQNVGSEHLELGDAPNRDDPVDPNHANNPKFEEYLKPFPSLLLKENTLNDISVNELFEWIKTAEINYRSGLLSQPTFTEEQRTKIEQWLKEYLSDELIQERLDEAMNPVEGGYRVHSGYDVYDFSITQIEKVVNLDLQKEDQTLTLTADLIVKVDQPIRVVYEISYVEGTPKLTGYQFTKLDKGEE